MTIDPAEAERIVSRCEQAVASSDPFDLAALGFWRVVAAAKRDPALRDRLAERLADVDRRAFRRWATLTVPIGVGTAVMTSGAVVGLAAVAAAYTTDPPWNGILLLAGTGILEATTHGLAHLAVGKAFGMRFTHWFVGTVTRPQPGVKVDYATYLEVPGRRRAWMHAAGALTTKVIPFLTSAAGVAAGVPGWAVAALVVLGVAQIVTDAVWSTKTSDWKKFRRERRYP